MLDAQIKSYQNHVDELKKTIATDIKHLSPENEKLSEKFENKCIEVKHLKAELEIIQKNKHVHGVALKTGKHELKGPPPPPYFFLIPPSPLIGMI